MTPDVYMETQTRRLRVYNKIIIVSALIVFIHVEIQAQHRPDRLKKPRTESVGTDRWGQVCEPVRRPVRRKAGSVQKPGGR